MRPGSLNEAIECSLTSYLLGSFEEGHVRYEALSYDWGNETTTFNISLFFHDSFLHCHGQAKSLRSTAQAPISRQDKDYVDRCRLHQLRQPRREEPSSFYHIGDL